VETFLTLGVQDDHGKSEPFNMAVLASRTLPGRTGEPVASGGIPPHVEADLADLPEVDIPIHGITNGIHIPSWISDDMAVFWIVTWDALAEDPITSRSGNGSTISPISSSGRPTSAGASGSSLSYGRDCRNSCSAGGEES